MARLIFICVFLFIKCALSIYSSSKTEGVTKPPLTTGFKTVGWQPKNAEQIVLHHNYSRVAKQGHNGFVSSTTHLESKQEKPMSYSDLKSHKSTKPVNYYVPKKSVKRMTGTFDTCPRDFTGVVAYPCASCNKFLNCYRGRGVVQVCAPGTRFSAETLECDHIDKVPCNDVVPIQSERHAPTKRFVQPDCPQQFCGIIPHYVDCSKFVQCDNGIAHVMTCGPGTVFDIRSNTCNFPEKTQCFSQPNSASVNQQYPSSQFSGSASQPNPANQYGVSQIVPDSQSNLCSTANCDAEAPSGYQQNFGGQYQPGYADHLHRDDRFQPHKGAHEGQTARCSPSGNCEQNSYGPTAGQNVPINQYQPISSGYQGHTAGCSPSGNCEQNSYGQTDGQNVPPTNQYQPINSGQQGQTARCSPSANCEQNSYGQTVGQNVPINQYQPTNPGHQGQIASCSPTGNCEQNSYGQTAGQNVPINQYQAINPGHQGQTARCSPTGNCEQNLYGQTAGQNVPANQYQSNIQRPLYGTSRSYTQQHNKQYPAQLNLYGQDRASAQDPLKCPPGFSGLRPHPTECDKFLNCGSGMTFIQPCGPGTVFNPTLLVCDWPYNVNCGSGQTHPSSGSTNYNQNITPRPGSWHLHNDTSLFGRNPFGGYPHVPTETPNYQNPSYPVPDYNSNVGQGSQGSWTSTNSKDNTPQGNTQSWAYVSPAPSSVPHHQSTTPLPRRPAGQGYNRPTPAYSHTQRPDPSRSNVNVQNKPGFPSNTEFDYEDIHPAASGTARPYGYYRQATTPAAGRVRSWPPPFPTNELTDNDYVYDDYDEATTTSTVPSVDVKQQGRCGIGTYQCNQFQCVPTSVVCDGKNDCQNGQDEVNCAAAIAHFSKTPNAKLAVKERIKYSNVTVTYCSKLCHDIPDFNCKSFNHRKIDGNCYLLDGNVATLGLLIIMPDYDYFENSMYQMDCSEMFICPNRKCLDRGRVCDGVNDCLDRSDERNCDGSAFGYSLQMEGGSMPNEGALVVKAFDHVGVICDDMFSLTSANVACKELGYELGALTVRRGSYFFPTSVNFANNASVFMMDDVICQGNETSLTQCDFSGWGVHNCANNEIVGVECQVSSITNSTCPDNNWTCKDASQCIPLQFLCDGIYDCADQSDEAARVCDAEVKIRLNNTSLLAGGHLRPGRVGGRLEVEYHGVWGTVCDDDFNEDAAKVVCKQLGLGRHGKVLKEAAFGAGEGPIWLDQVLCLGNETLIECEHLPWGEHNCEHNEDVSVICYDSSDEESQHAYKSKHGHHNIKKQPQQNTKHAFPVNEAHFKSQFTLPQKCGLQSQNLLQLAQTDVHFRVISGSIASPGDYPWQVAVRVTNKGKLRAKPTHWCGAVVIAPRFVLTAAHCLEGFAKGSLHLVAGDYDVDITESGEQRAEIDEYVMHPRFREGTRTSNDIAVVRLKGDGFELTDHVQAICLPPKESSAVGLNCTISGFGATEFGQVGASRQLRAGWIPVQPEDLCRMPHVYGDAFRPGMICAGSLKVDDDGEAVDACDGDSGGPLACLRDGFYTLFGITSWGQRCGDANKPGVYVDISYYRDWIHETIEKLAKN